MLARNVKKIMYGGARLTRSRNTNNTRWMLIVIAHHIAKVRGKIVIVIIIVRP